MTIIKNGSHDGDYGLRVSQEGRAQVDSVVETADRHINRTHQKVWSLPYEGVDPAAADDYFLYIRNGGLTNLAISDFRVESSVVGTVEVHAVSGTAAFVTGTDISPVNRYIGSSITPTAIIKYDTDITGLTDDGVIFWVNCDTVDKTSHLSTSSNIIIPPGQAVALSWDQATGVLKGLISLVEVDE